jgi:hypothetical protein
MDSSISQKDEIWFLRVCHHISNAVYRTVVSKLVLFLWQLLLPARRGWPSNKIYKSPTELSQQIAVGACGRICLISHVNACIWVYICGSLFVHMQ